ncbi:MAG: glycosyltransferase [Rickettsiales bacterium]|nr:MAG: glycosyltransferase [Rickettsiales bacterium]
MEIKKPLVSIALCTYNGEKYLCKQLDSLIKQDYPNLEIIIIDDASTDTTVTIIESYQSENFQIKLSVNESNIGFNQNFKKAIASCNGEYITIADQDDIWVPNKISVMMLNIKDNLLLYHDSEFIDTNGFSKGKSISTLHHFVKKFCTIQLLYNNCVSGHACLFKKVLIDIIPDVPKEMYYDWCFAYTAACIGKLDFIDLKLVKHRRHTTNSTNIDVLNAKAIRVKQLTFFSNHPLTPLTTKNIIDNLLLGYDELNYKSKSITLFLTFIKHFNTLFYTRKRSIFAKINFIIKECNRNS